MRGGGVFVTKKTTKKSTILTLRIATAVLLSLIVVLTGVGIYFTVNKKSPNEPEAIVNPLDFATDTWDGETEDNSSFLSGDKLGNRGERVYTINSASSFVYFVNLVNDEDRAKEYDYFRNYTIYLNSNIDLAGYSIQSIGKQITENGVTTSTFQGTFNGAYYSIMNANIVGSGLFGYIENANIQNIGLYNSTIDSTETYTGSIAGIAINTNISNTYVRLGSTKGSMVGGIVGAYISTNGPHEITNSFVDNTIIGDRVGALIGYLDTNHTSENAVTISNVYYTQNIDSINTLFYEGTLEENFVTLTNVIYATDISQFSTWNYTSEYIPTSDWCDYTYRENSISLDFRYPVQTGFVKVFLNGSYIENTVTINGTTTDSSTLAESFNQVNANDTAEVHIIVEKVYVEEEAVAKANATLTLTPDVETTLIRSDNNSENLIVGSSNSQLYIGEEQAQVNTPKITIDGNKDYVKTNNQQSGALIYAQGEDLIVGSNVILKNNINNTTGYGGGLSVYNINNDYDPITNTADTIVISPTVTNCEATKNGGGICIIGSTTDINNANVTNCTAENGGGISIMGANDADLTSTTALMSGYFKYGGSEASFLATKVITGSASVYNTTISNNTSNAYGGGVHCTFTSSDVTVTLSNCNISSNKAPNGGGGVYIAPGKVYKSVSGVNVNFYSTSVNSNSVTGTTGGACNGGGIYIYYYNSTGYSVGLTVSVRYGVTNNTAYSYGGGIYAYDNAYSSSNKLNLEYGAYIRGNSLKYSTSRGGGVYANCVYVDFNGGSKIYENSAYYGGGIYFANGSCYLGATTSDNIYDNNATSYGDNVYAESTSRTTYLYCYANISSSSSSKCRSYGFYVKKGSYSIYVYLYYASYYASSGKEFIGYSTSSSASTASWTSGTKTYSSTQTISSWYPVFASVNSTMRVTFNGNGGTVSGSTTRNVMENDTYGGKNLYKVDEVSTTNSSFYRSGSSLKGSITISPGGSSTIYFRIPYSSSSADYFLKNTTYTAVLDLNTSAGSGFYPYCYLDDGSGICNGEVSFGSIYAGTYVKTFTTKSSFSGSYLFNSYVRMSVPSNYSHSITFTPNFTLSIFYGDRTDELDDFSYTSYGSTQFSLPTATREDYEFLGWFTSPTDGTEVTASTIVTSTSNHTLYAHWQSITVTKSVNGTNTTHSVTKDSLFYPGEVSDIASNVKFNGWKSSTSDIEVYMDAIAQHYGGKNCETLPTKTTFGGNDGTLSFTLSDYGFGTYSYAMPQSFILIVSADFNLGNVGSFPIQILSTGGNQVLGIKDSGSSSLDIVMNGTTKTTLNTPWSGYKTLAICYSYGYMDFDVYLDGDSLYSTNYVSISTDGKYTLQIDTGGGRYNFSNLFLIGNGTSTIYTENIGVTLPTDENKGNFLTRVLDSGTITANYAVTEPTGSKLTYNATSQTGVASSAGYSRSGTYSATNAGDYSATVSLSKSYFSWSDGSTSNKTIGWSIAKRPLSECDIVLSTSSYDMSGSSYKYQASAITPGVTVKIGNNTVPSENYTVSYSNNVNVGTATVTVRATSDGNLLDSKSQNFTIAKRPLSECTISLSTTGYDMSNSAYKYQASAIMPAVTVTIKNNTVPSGNYTLSYSNNTNAGTATVTVSAKSSGNLSGSKSQNFTIAKRPVGECSITLSKTSFTFTGQPIKPGVTVKIHGNVVPPSNYTVHYSNNINVGKGSLWISATPEGNLIDGSGTGSGNVIEFDITTRPYNIIIEENGGSNVADRTYNVSASNQAIVIEAPTRGGYTFNGYTVTKNTTNGTSTVSNKNTLNIPANAYGDITIKAEWKENIYKVNINIVSPSGAEDYKNGTISTYYSYNGQTYENITDQKISDIAYNSTIKIYNIKPAAGMMLSSVTADKGTLVNNNDGSYTYTVSMTGTPSGSWDAAIYVNMKWKQYYVDINILNPSGSQDYNSGTMDVVYSTPSQSINDVTNEASSSLIQHGGTITISDIKPAAGYYLSRVYLTNSTGSHGTLKDNGDGTYTFTASSDWTHQTQWYNEIIIQMACQSYTLTIDANGGSYNGSTTVTQEFGSTLQLSTPTRDGYTFIGWSLSGAGSLSDDGSTNTEFTKTIKKENNGMPYVNYYMNHTAPTSDSWWHLTHPTYSYSVNETYTIRLIIRVNNSQNFPGLWLRHAVLGNDYDTSGSVATSIDSSKVGKGWIYVEMSRRITGSSYTHAGSTYETSPRFEVYTNNLIRSDKATQIFDFDLAAISITDSKGNLVYASTYYTFGAGNGKITAQWKANDYTTTFDANGGSVSQTSKTVTYNSTYGTLPTPSRDGYTFQGWYTAKTGGTKVTSSTVVTSTSNHTLYARWYVAIPTANTGLIYNGNVQTGVKSGTGYTLSGTYQATNAGTYTATVSLSNSSNSFWSDGSTGNKTITWSIGRATISAPSAVSGLVYNGSTQTGVKSGTGYTLGGTYQATNAGNYTATATPTSNYKWSDGSTGAKNISWSIAKRNLSDCTISLSQTSYTFDGSAKQPSVTVKIGSVTVATTNYSVTYSNNTNAGTATVTISATSSGNLTGSATVQFTINRKPINVPSAVSGLVYNGSTQTGVKSGTGYTLGGTYQATNAGSYTATATPTSNYKWSDGSTGAKNISWSIAKRNVSDCTISLSQTSYTFDGSAKEPSVTVKIGSVTVSSDNYSVSYSNNTNVGTATVTVTATSSGNLTGSATVQFTINTRSYNIVIDENNGSGTNDLTYNVSATSQTVKLPELTRTSYEFLGYTIINNTLGITSSISNKTTLNIPANAYGDITVQANWKLSILNVTLDANGGTVTPTTIQVTCESEYGDLPTPTRNGYEFAGWYTDKTNGTLVTSSTKVTATSDHTLYAHWSGKTYNVVINENGGNNTSDITYTVSGSQQSKTLPSLTRNGYTFDGYELTTNTTGATSSISDKTTLTIPANAYGDIEVTAKWIGNEYKVVIDENNGNATNDLSYTTSETSQTKQLPELTRSGYIFIGYTIVTNTLGGTSSITNKTTLNIPANAYGDITVKANWSVEVTIEIVGNKSENTLTISDGTKELTSGSNTVAEGSNITINTTLTANADASEYQLFSIYKDNELVITTSSLLDTEYTTTLNEAITTACTIRLEYKEGKRIVVNTDQGVTSEINISGTSDGDVYATDADNTITITIDTSSLTTSNETYIGFTYEINGETHSSYNTGDGIVEQAGSTGNEYIYTISGTDGVTNIDLIIRQSQNVTLTTNVEGYNSLSLTSEDGFTRQLDRNTSTYLLYVGRWEINVDLAEGADITNVLNAVFGVGNYTEDNGRYYYTITA